RQSRGGPPGCAHAPFSWQVRLEQPTGELIQVMGQVAPGQEATLSGVAPQGRFRPVVRGVPRLSDGEQPFVARGPVIEGLMAEQIAALRAQELPPVFAPSQGAPESRRVGVYMGGLGAEAVLK